MAKDPRPPTPPPLPTPFRGRLHQLLGVRGPCHVRVRGHPRVLRVVPHRVGRQLRLPQPELPLLRRARTVRAVAVVAAAVVAAAVVAAAVALGRVSAHAHLGHLVLGELLRAHPARYPGLPHHMPTSIHVHLRTALESAAQPRHLGST